MTLSGIILRLLGWKIEGSINAETQRAIMVIAPHTSIWDFIIGRLAFNVLKIRAKFLIKKGFFFFPLGLFLKLWGGIPVERKKKTHLVDHIATTILNKEKLILVITPEGTRQRVNKWKKGFYYISQRAKVPIIPGFLDYKRKIARIGKPFYPSGNFESDLIILNHFYKDVTARYPNKYNPVIR